MILECPSCRARYLVPVEAFAAGGRKVRCARCKHEWHATKPNSIDVFTPPVPLAAPIAAAPVAPVPPPAPVEKVLSQSPASAAAVPHAPVIHIPNLPALIKGKKVPLWLKKVILGLGVLMAVLSLPLYYHETIVKHVPALSGLYETFGLTVAHSGKGLVFEQVKSELRYDGGTMKLFVDGVIHNTTDEIQLIPDIKARALGPDKAIIQSWWVRAPAPSVDAGADAPFHTEIAASMERTIEDVYLEFTAEDEKPDVTP